jgi:hypothetical protein
MCLCSALTGSHGGREVNLVILNFVDETPEKTKIISLPHLRVFQNLVCEMLDIEEECLPQ